MEREIKFRGLRIDGKVFVHGCLVIKHGVTYISTTFRISRFSKKLAYTEIKVIPETVGQYTGLKDKNGIDIYEGDEVNIYGKPYNVNNTFVVWGLKSHGWSVKCNVIDIGIGFPKIKYYSLGNSSNIEIIGNIYEK